MKVPNRNKGKPGREALLPNRAAVNRLLKGPPGDRTTLDFGELTPVGRKAIGTPYPSITAMGQKGTKIER